MCDDWGPEIQAALEEATDDIVKKLEADIEKFMLENSHLAIEGEIKNENL